jgi:hypothetical protein
VTGGFVPAAGVAVAEAPGVALPLVLGALVGVPWQPASMARVSELANKARLTGAKFLIVVQILFSTAGHGSQDVVQGARNLQLSLLTNFTPHELLCDDA